MKGQDESSGAQARRETVEQNHKSVLADGEHVDISTDEIAIFVPYLVHELRSKHKTHGTLFEDTVRLDLSARRLNALLSIHREGIEKVPDNDEERQELIDVAKKFRLDQLARQIQEKIDARNAIFEKYNNSDWILFELLDGRVSVHKERLLEGDTRLKRIFLDETCHRHPSGLPFLPRPVKMIPFVVEYMCTGTCSLPTTLEGLETLLDDAVAIEMGDLTDLCANKINELKNTAPANPTSPSPPPTPLVASSPNPQQPMAPGQTPGQTPATTPPTTLPSASSPSANQVPTVPSPTARAIPVDQKESVDEVITTEDVRELRRNKRIFAKRSSGDIEYEVIYSVTEDGVFVVTLRFAKTCNNKLHTFSFHGAATMKTTTGEILAKKSVAYTLRETTFVKRDEGFPILHKSIGSVDPSVSLDGLRLHIRGTLSKTTRSAPLTNTKAGPSSRKRSAQPTVDRPKRGAM